MKSPQISVALFSKKPTGRAMILGGLERTMCFFPNAQRASKLIQRRRRDEELAQGEGERTRSRNPG